MLHEDWNKWEPIQQLSPTYSLEELVDNNETFYLVCLDETNSSKKIID